jgi:drug/metabolite transporter (DMT)-like permease
MYILMNNKALLYMIFFSLFRAVDILLWKRIYAQGIDPMVWIVQVYMFVLLIWVGYILRAKKAQSIQVIQRARWPFLLVSVTAALGTAASYVWLSMTEAINYSFLGQMSMVFTVILAHIRFSDERLSSLKWFLVGMFLLGVYIVSTNGQWIIPQVGDWFVILWAFFFSINNITIKECLQRGIQIPTIILGRNIATLSMWCIVAYSSYWSISFVWSMWGYAVLSAIFVSIRLTSLNKVIEYSSPSYMVMMSMVNPVVVLVWAVLLLGETFSGIQMLGGSIIIVSWIVLEYARRK